MTKAALRCVAFKPVCRNSLRGFASIAFDDLMMTLHGVGIHVGANGPWAAPPAQPLTKSSTLLKSDTGFTRRRCWNSAAPASARRGRRP